jgi:glycosyltransferase involved in cell wall biosynthesis
MSNVTPEAKRYVLVTAAYNEERYIEAVIKSILSQTLRPLRWAIVSDGSTDSTDEVVQNYAAQFDFIELYRSEDDHPRGFAAKANALKLGYERLMTLEYGFIGILDADITFEPNYYSSLVDGFSEDPTLGVTGGFIYENGEGGFTSRVLNRHSSVAGAAQFFRRECYERIGGIQSLEYGGEDTFAEVSARMAGWSVHSRSDLKVFHHRPTGGATGWMRGSFRQGRMDYSLGIHPLFEICRLLLRVSSKPWCLYAGVRLAGFCFSYCILEKRMVSREFVRFLRKEEVDRLGGLFMRKSAHR